MQSSLGASLLAAAAAAVAGCDGPRQPPLSLDRIEPASAAPGATPTLTVHGAGFRPAVHVPFSGSAGVVDATFRVWLDSRELEEVTFVDAATLTARLTRPLGMGSHRLRVRDPRGDEAELEDAFEITRSDGDVDGGDLDGDAAPGDATVGDGGDAALSCNDPLCTATCDLGCAGGCSCSNGCPCNLSCTGSNCTAACNGDGTHCTVDFASSSQAQLDCSGKAGCDVDLSGSTNGTVFCSGQGSCSVDCHDSSNCRVLCTGNAICLLDCTNATNCRIEQCVTTPTTCGEMFACGRGC